MKKLCLNCAYRANCQKRFGVTVVNDEVRCVDYAADYMLLKKEAAEVQEKNNEQNTAEKKDDK